MQRQYYILKGIGPEGIRFKPDPYDDSQGDGTILYNGEQVSSLHDRIANNYMRVNAVNSRSFGYIDMKHLDPPPPQYAPPPGPPSYGTVMSKITNYPLAYQDSVSKRHYSVDPNGNSYWLNGGLRRRKFRSHKKHHVRSRSRPRSKKSCSRRR